MLRSEPFWSLPTPPTQPGRPEPLEIVKVALTIVAGVGGLVALTVAYRRQLWLEADTAGARERQKALHDRYGAAVTQLGHDNPNVRLAGVYALANLADEWATQRQQCVDVLCAYLRVPWNPDPDEKHPTARKVIQSPGPRRATTTYTYPSGLGESEVRRTIIRTIAEHLRGPGKDDDDPQPGPWSGLALDFTGALLPESIFNRCTFATVRFSRTHFLDPAEFDRATFSGAARFEGAMFFGPAWFDGVTFSGGARFGGVTFSGGAMFRKATFSEGARFEGATFSGGALFDRATFARDAMFHRATFSGDAMFDWAKFAGVARLDWARFSESATFRGAMFSGGAAFGGSTFGGDTVFNEATFAKVVMFDEAAFSEGARFRRVRFFEDARFREVTFSGGAVFDEASFRRGVPSELEKFVSSGESSWAAQ